MSTILSPLAELKEYLQDIAFDLPSRLAIARWAPVPLRLIVGLGFIQHGFATLTKGPETFAVILHALAVPAPHFVAWITILTELLGGLAILLGAIVSLVSLAMAALLLAVTASGAQFGPPGYGLLYLACLAALVWLGSGPLAIDGLFRRIKEILSAMKGIGITG